MIIKNLFTGRNCGKSIWPAVVMALAVLSAGTVGYAQPTAEIVRQNLQEIVRLSQAHMTDAVLASYIKTSGKTYYVKADDLIYLNSQGVSQAVLSALLAASPSAAPAPAPCRRRRSL
jgi:hypothetical protein